MSDSKRYMPGGVNSPVRAFGAVGGDPVVIARGQGSSVTDVDGNRYIDYVGSWGPLILGHADREVVAAVQQAAACGTSFGAPTEWELDLARRIVDAVPSVELVRLVNSGTEATMSTLRLARAATGRDRIVKFAGCYHGHTDALLVEAGSGALTFGTPNSPGVSAQAAGETLVLPYNDAAAARRLFDEYGTSIAACIVEPVAGNMGVVPPASGFLETLRELTRAHGALLIFDEVITGFRLALGGAQERFGVLPDLSCFGKVIGGGLPVGAYGGREDLMRRVSPEGPVYQAGTLSGNPLAVRAGTVTIDRLSQPGVYTSLDTRAADFADALRDAARAAGVPVQVNRVGSMLTVFFSDVPVRGYDAAQGCRTAAYGRFFQGMLRRGVYLPPSQFEAVFVSLAHTDEDFERTVNAAREAFAEAASE